MDREDLVHCKKRKINRQAHFVVVSTTISTANWKTFTRGIPPKATVLMDAAEDVAD